VGKLRRESDGKMPTKASEGKISPYLRLLLLGPPKCGKTVTTLMTCPKPAYLINSGGEGAWQGALPHTTDFEFDDVNQTDSKILNSFEAALKVAREGVAAGKYKTIIWDEFSTYAYHLLNALEAATDKGSGPDGRRVYPEYTKRLVSAVERLMLIPAHLIVLSHFYDSGAEIEGQLKKEGKGIMPAVAGAARQKIPGLFPNVAFLEKRGANRFLMFSLDGVWGPGTRNLPGVDELPADISLLCKKIASAAGVPKKVKVGK